MNLVSLSGLISWHHPLALALARQIAHLTADPVHPELRNGKCQAARVEYHGVETRIGCSVECVSAKHHHHANGNTSGVLRPWSSTFSPSTSFTTLDGKPVEWNGGWASVAGQTDGQGPAPIQSHQGNKAGPTYLPFPELTCLHCLGSNPPGKLGYVVSYLPVIASEGQSYGFGAGQPENQVPVLANGNGSSHGVGQSNGHGHLNGHALPNGHGHGTPERGRDITNGHALGQSHDEDSHDERADTYRPLPSRSPAPSHSALRANRTGREAFRSDQRERRARSRAEERAADIERGRHMEREEQAERARSSSVSWELAGVAKQYVPDGEEGDVVIE
ncbi:hypothetical protein IAU60_001234 [Kwoniella sp. DSM 27419]